MKTQRYLTADDKANLASFAVKAKELASFTLGCIRGTQTGLLLFGAGGTGKSYGIRDTLMAENIKAIPPNYKGDMPGHNSWIIHQGRVTPKGLVVKMKEYPKSIHIIEDAETILDDKNCAGVLRSALHSQDGAPYPERRVTWVISTAKGSLDFMFTGSLIIVGNRNLGKKRSDEMAAVMTRCPTMSYDIANEELIAKMKELCLEGYNKIPGYELDSDDCFDVLDYMLTAREIEEAKKNDPLNLRLVITGFRYMALSLMEGTDWRAMLLSDMNEQVYAKQSRADRIKDEKAIAQQINSKEWQTEKDKLVEWCRRTGRDLTGSQSPQDSPEYKKWHNAAQVDLWAQTQVGNASYRK